MRTSLRTLVGVSAALVLAGTIGTASAADPAGWHGNPGSTYDSGVVTLTNSGGAGTSYENANLPVNTANGDTISFEGTSSDVDCAGGAPRVFVRGGAYNPYDAAPAGPGACGTDSNGDG